MNVRISQTEIYGHVLAGRLEVNHSIFNASVISCDTGHITNSEIHDGGVSVWCDGRLFLANSTLRGWHQDDWPVPLVRFGGEFSQVINNVVVGGGGIAENKVLIEAGSSRRARIAGNIFDADGPSQAAIRVRYDGWNDAAVETVIENNDARSRNIRYLMVDDTPEDSTVIERNNLHPSAM